MPIVPILTLVLTTMDPAGVTTATIAAVDDPGQTVAVQRSAADPPQSGETSGVTVHGFLSQGYIRSTDNNYLVKSKRGSFEFGEAGINATKGLTDRLRIGAQLFAQDMGAAGRFRARADWYQIDYRYADWLGLRAGRVKLPFGLYNDISDIDSARVPILLPQSIYSIENRNFLLAQSGGELYGYVPLSKYGNLDYRAYGGTIIPDEDITVSGPFGLRGISNPYIAGARVLWEPPLENLRLGASLQTLRLDSELFFPAVTQTVTVKSPAVLWVASLEYAIAQFELSAEYSRWHVTTKSSMPSLVPESKVESERAYLMATYRAADWLQMGSYYSRLIPNVANHKGPDSLQNDTAGTLRFDINPHWLVKLEGHFLWGTAGLNAALNPGARSSLEERWGLFLLKTTAYF